MNAIWKEDAGLPRFPSLDGEIRTDVLIIGGGLAGILCAYFLQEQGVDYIVAEGRSIASGTTGNTTAKITSQHGLIYHKLLKHAGTEQAKMYLEANQNAVNRYARLCRDMDCGFEERPSYVYSLDDRKKLEDEAEALHQLGFSARLAKTPELPFPTAGAVCFDKQAQFHPLKFISNIARNLRIYEHTFVKALSEHTAVTDKAKIHWKKLIVATHFPVDNKHGLYFLKMYQHRSYVIALKNAGKIWGMYVDEAKKGMSFRSYEDLILIGGGSHRTGKKGGNWQELRSFANCYYPSAAEAGCWAAQDCMPLDDIPYIGQYSKKMPDCYVASGFQKWGITSSMIAAQLLCDLIMERENPYQEIYNPQRSIWKPQLFLNGLESMVNLLTPTAKRCPHLGCALKWNADEHSWDCPCHGSRFAEDGTLLDNPANGSKKIKAQKMSNSKI